MYIYIYVALMFFSHFFKYRISLLASPTCAVVVARLAVARLAGACVTSDGVGADLAAVGGLCDTLVNVDALVRVETQWTGTTFECLAGILLLLRRHVGAGTSCAVGCGATVEICLTACACNSTGNCALNLQLLMTKIMQFLIYYQLILANAYLETFSI